MLHCTRDENQCLLVKWVAMRAVIVVVGHLKSTDVDLPVFTIVVCRKSVSHIFHLFIQDIRLRTGA